MRSRSRRCFSFNNPFGACPRCQGFGNTIDFDLNLVIPDVTKTLGDGAIEPWTKPKYRAFQADLRKFAKQSGIPTDVPWIDLDADQKQFVIAGEGKFPGIQGFFSALERKKYKLHVRVFLSRYRGYAQCPECGGGRLRADALQVKIENKNIRELTSLTVGTGSGLLHQPQALTGAGRDRGKNSGADSGAAEVPERCGSGISHAGPPGGNALRRRSPENPAGHFTRIPAGRRAVCAG